MQPQIPMAVPNASAKAVLLNRPREPQLTTLVMMLSRNNSNL